jgi:hypothetical protein
MKKVLIPIILVLGLFAIGLVVGASFYPKQYKPYKVENLAQIDEIVQIPPPFKVTHVSTPSEVKALYMSSWVAGNKKLRDNLINIVDTTELNAVVIDIKDYTGKISYISENPTLVENGSMENRIPDIKEFIGTLHDKHIYVIGRISSFQDSYLVHRKPEYAVKNMAGDVWKDYKGVSWLDVSARPVWDYLVAIGDDAYAQGFDELNFDYIRFPSDGNMKDIMYPFSEEKIKSLALKDFFAFLDESFRSKNIPISADLFGMTTSNKDDLGIGQILEYALAHFDYVAPMVYPSHYPKTFLGYDSPASKPYEVVKYAMEEGVKKAVVASTSPMKLRPWLQDFSIGRVDYTPEMVRAQIQATYDVGLNSWMLWNASNIYTSSALLPEELSTTTPIE